MENKKKSIFDDISDYEGTGHECYITSCLINVIILFNVYNLIIKSLKIFLTLLTKAVYNHLPLKFNLYITLGNVKIINSEENQKKKSVFDDISDSENDHEYHTTSKFISAIEVRRPLYDHRLQLTKRTEAIKSKLWNEIYVKLKGGFKISIFKK